LDLTNEKDKPFEYNNNPDLKKDDPKFGKSV
jgi:hypothetical protein